MFTRGLAFVTASALIALAGCSSGTHQNFTPLANAPAGSLRSADLTERVLHGFSGAVNDGAAPISGLTKVGGILYGVSAGGGRYGAGTIFSIYPNGVGFRIVYSFQGPQDGTPLAPTALTNAGGTLYGTTSAGGAKNNGTVFSITPAGTFKTIYSFKGGSSDGANPETPLVNVRGTLYGTTYGGGSVTHGNTTCNGCGTFFSISQSGQEKVRYFFGSVKGDGTHPLGTIVYLNNTFYGSAAGGGPSNAGAIFSTTKAGKEAVLYAFRNKNDGRCNGGYCNLTQLNGKLFGTAFFGGKKNLGSIFSVTTAGTFKTLWAVNLPARSGAFPNGPLTYVNGKFYGTMSDREFGNRLNGTVFSIKTDGTFKMVYGFAGQNDGSQPMSGLTYAGGVLVGTTDKGGGPGFGSIYSIKDF